MSQHQYDIQLGQIKETVTVASGASIGSSAVRVTIDDANAVSKAQALQMLDIIQQVIEQAVWPPVP